MKLNRETIRRLTDGDLAAARGGTYISMQGQFTCASCACMPATVDGCWYVPPNQPPVLPDRIEDRLQRIEEKLDRLLARVK